jgi:hypothetical protein
MAKKILPEPAGNPCIIGLLSDEAIVIVLKELHRQRADSQIAFGTTRARQKRILPVSDDLPSDVYLESAGDLRAEAKRRGIK